MKAETVSQSILDSLENGIAKAKETVGLIDAAIDHFGKFYLNRIRETQKYPEDLFESQINLLRQELSLEDSFSRKFAKQIGSIQKTCGPLQASGGKHRPGRASTRSPFETKFVNGKIRFLIRIQTSIEGEI